MKMMLSVNSFMPTHCRNNKLSRWVHHRQLLSPFLQYLHWDGEGLSSQPSSYLFLLPHWATHHFQNCSFLFTFINYPCYFIYLECYSSVFSTCELSHFLNPVQNLIIHVSLIFSSIGLCQTLHSIYEISIIHSGHSLNLDCPQRHTMRKRFVWK